MAIFFPARPTKYGFASASYSACSRYIFAARRREREHIYRERMLRSHPRPGASAERPNVVVTRQKPTRFPRMRCRGTRRVRGARRDHRGGVAANTYLVMRDDLVVTLCAGWGRWKMRRVATERGRTRLFRVFSFAPRADGYGTRKRGGFCMGFVPASTRDRLTWRGNESRGIARAASEKSPQGQGFTSHACAETLHIL